MFTGISGSKTVCNATTDLIVKRRCPRGEIGAACGIVRLGEFCHVDLWYHASFVHGRVIRRLDVYSASKQGARRRATAAMDRNLQTF